MNKSQKINNPIVWVDLEMTGLDHNTNQIMEIAVLVTDGNLEQTIEGPEIIVKAEKQVLEKMDAWCTKTHGESGLTQKCLESKISIEQAEKQVLDFLKNLNINKFEAQLGGNSVHMDRRFINKYMPQLDDFLHYRIIDVSTIKELARRWYPEEMEKKPVKKLCHRALDDIIESIEELKFYKKNIFKN
ncbi:Ribonuclease H-like domain [Pseudocohnilembus persalinus]|uniref:Ribonuclease H-like domain n=1 Tax=Pseudocohnilembus persalinus TaxID=266149 RepID=A0A0V0R1R0_PSEPJ|nr:Ribonuclease H-like domain [Pseudocohnilembus persalinus]|eukprot:KRX08470.1 Ribonuclease H-like domain [Pseudocohnilembus persalinus]